MTSPPRHPLPVSGDLRTISFRQDSRIVREALRLSAFLRRSGRAATLHLTRCLRSHGAAWCLRHGLTVYRGNLGGNRIFVCLKGMALRKTSDVGKIEKQSSERFGLPCTAVVVLDRKMSALATTPEAEDETKIRSPAAPCQEAVVKNDAGGAKFYAPERVFDRKSSLQMLGTLPLFVPAAGKPTLAAWAEAALRIMPCKEEENKRSAVKLSSQTSPPTTDGLTLLRAPIRGFASKPAPALTLLVRPPLDGFDVGFGFV